MKSSSAGLFGVVVAILSIISAVISITSSDYNTALLAIAFAVGGASLLFVAQNIGSQIEDLRHDLDSLRNQSSGTSNNNSLNASLENSIKDLKRELKEEISKINKSPESISLPLPSAQLNNIGAPTTALSPSSAFNNASSASNSEASPIPSIKKESYQAFGVSPLPPPQSQSQAFQQATPGQSAKFSQIADDPNRTNASFATPKSPVTAANTPVSDTGSHDAMETTQSFLPHVPSGNSERFQTENNSANLSTEATIGFDANSLPQDPRSSYTEAPKSPSKVHSKIKKRYSTFAGLSLNEDSQEANKYREDLLTPPPPPPPPGKIEKKRYSTFAGLALGERSRINPPSSPSPSSIAPPSTVKAGNPLSILSPSTVTNLGFSKNTDGMGVSREELMESNNNIPNNSNAPSNYSSPVNTSSVSSQGAPAISQTKGTRKRYQTFMGLSLSKTPQPIKRYDEPPIDATAPLSAAGTGASYGKAPAPSSLQAAINRGQQGNLVDGFCSLCGSPQAAANDYATTGSEPEFCWYCGAKLK